MLVTDVFGGATAGASTLTIPNTSITSYSNGDTGQEMIFGMLETFATALDGSGLNNVTVSTGSSLLNNGAVLQKTYSFVVNLDFDAIGLDNLDVLAE